MITNIELVKSFIQVTPEDDNTLTEIILAVEEKVQNYLGYNIEEADRTDYVSGGGTNQLYLKSFPIEQPILIDGVALTTDYEINRNCLTVFDSTFNFKQRYKVEYSGGYAPLAVPSSIKVAIYQCTGLINKDSGNRIGASGVSDANLGTSTWEKLTDFLPRLKELNSYKLLETVI